MSFPFEFDDDEEELVNQEREYVEYEVDFENGKLTGNKLYGLDAIRQWAYMALNTVRYQHIVKSWDYGCEVEELIGKGYSSEHVESELTRMIYDCLIMHAAIDDINVCDYMYGSDTIRCTVVIKTNMGEVSVDV